ncbi:MAG: hypothetical protein QXZ54_00285 [Candidatus Methanomethylicia archaeon]
MNKNIGIFLSILLLSLFLLSLSSVEAQVKKPKIVVWLKGATGTVRQYEAVRNDLTQYEWVNETGTLTASKLEEAFALIVVLVDSMQPITTDEINVIKNWLATGKKLLWVAGDSDYGNDMFRQDTVNNLLKGVGSVLRVDLAECIDATMNAGADYRVLGLSDKCDEEVKFLVAGVTRALFHGPAAIVAEVGGRYVALNKEKVTNVYRIMWTSVNGSIAEFNEPPSKVYQQGVKDRYVLMALEVDPAKKNVIILSGDAPFDHYEGMYKPELGNPTRYGVQYPQQGATLLANILSWTCDMDRFFAYLAMPGQIASLNQQISNLNKQISDLQGQIAYLNSMMPIYAIVSLIVGLAIGFAIPKYILKK